MLLGTVLGITIGLVAILSLSADYLARQIPVTVERQWAANLFQHSDNPRIDAYLNELAQEIAPFFRDYEDQRYLVHYSDSNTINAYAYLGGHIVITRGLLSALDSENALVMVLAHEMAHVAERHPIRSLGRGMIVSAFLVTVTGLAGDWLSANVISKGGVLTSLKFSRDHESVADELALAALHARYGHHGGADELFVSLMRNEQNLAGEPPEIFSTHPATERRLRAVRGEVSNTETPKLQPLPWALKGWLESDS